LKAIYYKIGEIFTPVNKNGLHERWMLLLVVKTNNEPETVAVGRQMNTRKYCDVQSAVQLSLAELSEATSGTSKLLLMLKGHILWRNFVQENHILLLAI
jgi:hypothetical protein